MIRLNSGEGFVMSGLFLRAGAFRGIIGAIALSAMGFGAAQAQLLERVTATQLEELLSNANMSPTIISDAQRGTPVAQGKAGGFDFFVRALGCSGQPAACSELVFFANFKLGRALNQRDRDIINAYNDSRVFGRAYFIPASQEIGVDYVVELGGGVSQSHIEGNIGRWSDVLHQFVEDFRKASTSAGA